MSDFIAGLAAGTASTYVGHPFDTVKTLLQISPKKYNSSALHCARLIVNDHGLRALYRGVTLPVTCSAINNGLIFHISESIFRQLQGSEYEREEGFDSRRFYSGAVAGVAQSFVTSPFELVKCKMQSMRVKQLEHLTNSTKNSSNKLESLAQTCRKIPLQELAHNGLVYTILRDSPAYGLYFYFFHGIKHTYQLKEPHVVSDLAHFDTWFLAFTGGLCGCLGWVVCYPVDVLKSRKQVCGATPKMLELPSGWWYRGLAPTMLRTFPVNMVRFTVYLLVKNNLDFLES